MKSRTILLVAVMAALLVLPVLFGFIGLLYYLDVHPSLVGMLSALAAVVIARFTTPVLRRFALRLESNHPAA